jgi:hypothetical protein
MAPVPVAGALAAIRRHRPHVVVVHALTRQVAVLVALGDELTTCDEQASEQSDYHAHDGGHGEPRDAQWLEEREQWTRHQSRNPTGDRPCLRITHRACRSVEYAASSYVPRYVFPDAAPLHLSRIQVALERAGLETVHVEGFRSDYAQTLRHWAARLDGRRDEALALAGPERLRVWRLYLRAARRGFERGFTSIYQVLAQRPES